MVSPGTPVSSTNKTDCHSITEILLQVALNTIHNIRLYVSNRLLLAFFCMVFGGGNVEIVGLVKFYETYQEFPTYKYVFFKSILTKVFFFLAWYNVGFCMY